MAPASPEDRRHRLALALVAGVAALVLAPLLRSGSALPLNPDWVGPIRMAWLDRAALLGAHQLPLQIPAVDGGSPLLGHPHDLAAGPWLALVLLFGPVLGVKLVAALVVALGGLGTTRLARRGLGLGPAGAALAGGLFVAGAALPAALRSGSLPKLQLAMLPWILVGWHTGGRRGVALVAGGLALVLGHAGPAGAAAVLVLLAWAAGTSTRARWRTVAAALPLAALLVAGKAAGVAALLSAGPLAGAKGGGSLADWAAVATGMDPVALVRSLVIPPLAAARPTWPAEPGLVHLGLGGLFLVPGAVHLARRRRAAGAWVLLVLGAAVLPWLVWGPVVALLPPLRTLEKVDKAMVVPVALALALVAGAGLDALQRRGRWRGPVALGVAAGALLSAAVASRPLVTGLFPVAALPTVAGARLGGATVLLPQGPAAWHDPAALWRLALAAEGVGVAGIKEFSRPGAPRPTHTLALRPPVDDWRPLAAGLREGRPLPVATLVPVAGAPPPARWAGDDPARGPLQLTEGPGWRQLSGLAGAGGRILLDRRAEGGWQVAPVDAQDGVCCGILEVDGRMAVDVPAGREALRIEHRAPGAALAWGLSLLGWLAVLGLGLWPRRGTESDGPAPGLSGGGG